MAPAKRKAKAEPARRASRSGGRAPRAPTPAPATWTVDNTLKALKAAGLKKVRDEMAPRYGIVAQHAYGVPMRDIIALGKEIGTDHELARALWKTGVYEARLLVSKIGDPAKLTPAEMDRWAKEFDNWGVVDTLCFNFLDRSKDAFAMVDRWAKRRGEFEKRAAFALLACLALHGKGTDQDYLSRLALIEAASGDERNFVWKGALWALRAIGGRKSPATRAAARELAQRLAASDNAAARRLGKTALRELQKSK